jgi:hypothetical protein
MNPMTGIAGCWERAASGQAAAAPPSSDMNSRVSFNHLLGAREQRRRHSEPKRAGGRKIDDELEPGRLHRRQVGRLGALEKAGGIDADLLKDVREARSIAHQTAGLREFAHVIDATGSSVALNTIGIVALAAFAASAATVGVAMSTVT